MIVRLSNEAERDIEAIGDYSAQDHPARALAFVQSLRVRCLGLADMPRRFPLVSRYATEGIRQCLHGEYLIFYRVDPDAVVVIHILHARQDYDPLLAIS